MDHRMPQFEPGAEEEFDRCRPTNRVAPSARFIGISERQMRRALAPGGDLEDLAIRVGKRVLVKTAALLALVEQ